MNRCRFIMMIAAIILSLSAAFSQPFEGTLYIKTTYKQNTHDTLPAINEFKMVVKGDKALIDHKGFGKMILNTAVNEVHIVVSQGTQPVVWKVNLNTLNQLGGLLLLMKAATGRDVMTITPRTQLTPTHTTSVISGYKCTKYTTTDNDHTGSLWVTNDFPHDLSGIWNALNITPVMKSAGITKGMILKATSKSLKTGESNTLLITPKMQKTDESLFELPAASQIIDITPLLTQMMQNQNPEDVQKMLLQMMPQK